MSLPKSTRLEFPHGPNRPDVVDVSLLGTAPYLLYVTISGAFDRARIILAPAEARRVADALLAYAAAADAKAAAESQGAPRDVRPRPAVAEYFAMRREAAQLENRLFACDAATTWLACHPRVIDLADVELPARLADYRAAAAEYLGDR